MQSGLNPLDTGFSLLTRFPEHLFTVQKVSTRYAEIPGADPVLRDLFRRFEREKPKKQVVD